MNPILTEKFINLKEEELTNIDPIDISLYCDSFPFYFQNHDERSISDHSFHQSHQQLLLLLRKIALRHPKISRKITELKENVEHNLTITSSNHDKLAILFTVKKCLESLYLQFREKLASLEASDIQDLIVNICLQGACSNIMLFRDRVVYNKASGIDSFVIRAKKELIQQLAQDFIRKHQARQKVLVMRGHNIHTVNALFNYVSHKYGLIQISDTHATNLDYHTILKPFQQYVEENFTALAITQTIKTSLCVSSEGFFDDETARTLELLFKHDDDRFDPKMIFDEWDETLVDSGGLYKMSERSSEGINYKYDFLVYNALECAGFVTGAVFKVQDLDSKNIIYQTPSRSFIVSQKYDEILCNDRKTIRAPITNEDYKLIIDNNQKRAELSTVDSTGSKLLSFDCFTGSELLSFNFRDANLCGTRFSNLHNVDLRGAKLYQIRANNSSEDLTPDEITTLIRSRNLTATDSYRWVSLCQLSGANLYGTTMDAIQVIGLHQFHEFNTSQPRLSFEGVDLLGADFSRVFLQNIDLNHAILRATFIGARLHNAKLMSANFRHANLSGATLDKSNLSDADLRDTNLLNTRFQDTILKGANFEGVDLKQTDFCSSLRSLLDLKNVNFNWVDLAGRSLEHMILENASLCEANLRNTSLKHISFLNANLRKTDFRGATLHTLCFKGANLRGTDFRVATLQALKFKDADLRGADFRGATLFDLDFNGADLRGADFRGAKIDAKSFCTANLKGAKLDGIQAEAICRLPDNPLAGVDLRGADLGAIDFYVISLIGAMLKGAKLNYNSINIISKDTVFFGNTAAEQKEIIESVLKEYKRLRDETKNTYPFPWLAGKMMYNYPEVLYQTAGALTEETASTYAIWILKHANNNPEKQNRTSVALEKVLCTSKEKKDTANCNLQAVFKDYCVRAANTVNLNSAGLS